jgi:putative DNA primase/helicase
MPYLQQALGYSMTGNTSEKAFFICYGISGTSKTTILDAVRKTFPEYSTTILVDTLMAKSGGLDNNAQSDLADLRGARFAQTSETEPGQRLKEGQLKRLTQGTGIIKAARKYENLIQWPESHKLWMDANNLPTIRDGTGVFERLHLIPFRNVIEEAEQNKNIHTDLDKERAGIAAWVVQSALDWIKAGRLVRPQEVQAGGQEYKQSQDQMAEWISECCLTGEGEHVSTDVLRASFNDFAARTGDRTLNQTHFRERMEARGFKYRRLNSLRFFEGIRLAPRAATEFLAA